jgi:hypothetical protein
VSKDRAAPFSRKHRLYWMTVTGGMLLIGAINVFIGFMSYDEPTGKREKIEFDLPTIYRDAGIDAAVPDAPIDATPSN